MSRRKILYQRKYKIAGYKEFWSPAVKRDILVPQFRTSEDMYSQILDQHSKKIINKSGKIICKPIRKEKAMQLAGIKIEE
jgi:hypothetical protein